MFLRRLLIKGFKSFADRTVFDFTPGVAVIVGPNGSGKSNLVDAIAWVLGEQGVKTLRGGKMEDVIFAGTPSRPSLGRAEVELTIDNSSGILPIDFTEVTVGRTLFRSGESEYTINGVPCRLLDVQELLSDSGIGRELHTIVGQGQLDDILQGSATDRRAVIEEASGLLKHRKRKEKALRKLDRVESDLDRLGDVINELRRQIRPLEKQAELAKRAQEIEDELREVKLKLWVLDYRASTSEEDADAERRALEEVEALTGAVTDLATRAESLERSLGDAARGAEAVLATEYKLRGVRDRFEGLARFADERRVHLEDLVAREPRGEAPSDEEIAAAERAIEAAGASRVQAESEARHAERERVAVQAARDEAARAREEVVHLHGERAALRAAVEGADDERRRITERREQVRASREQIAIDVDRVRAELGSLDAEETSHAARADEAEGRRDAKRGQVDALQTQEREAERRAEKLQTRRTMLEEEIARRVDPLGALEGVSGVGGRLYDAVHPTAGYEVAVRAALGPLADAVLATTRADAMAAIETLKRAGARGVIATPGAGRAPVPAGVRSLMEFADLGGPFADVARAALDGIAFAENLAEAAEIAHAHPQLHIVTRDGDLLSPTTVSGGAPIDERDPRDELRRIETELNDAIGALEALRRDLDHARAELRVLESECDALEEQLSEVDTRVAGATERLAQFERESHALAREEQILTGRFEEIDQRLGEETERLRAVEARLAKSVAQEPAVDMETLARIERMAAERALRLGEMTERERAAARALHELQERARKVAAERERYETGRERWARGAVKAGDVAAAARTVAERVSSWVADAEQIRMGGEERRRSLEAELQQIRSQRRDAENGLEEARRRAHEADLRRAERAHRIAALVQKLREDYDLAPTEATEAVSAAEADRDELQRRATTCDRRLALLGRVNPIAMEQYQSLVDRHNFLNEQVGDLRKSKRDLMSVVEEVDAKIVEIFAAAFADISREFDEVFARLFPGGEGRMVLTEPDNLLDSGVDIEARPAGKKVKRVSLLSGGERSLVAVAMLFSVFRARPSPFYLLDEVEPALDDVNLHRFLDIAAEFRDTSQLLIVTHQKRTMEIADALYGISMAGQGVSKVICERLRLPDGEEVIPSKA